LAFRAAASGRGELRPGCSEGPTTVTDVTGPDANLSRRREALAGAVRRMDDVRGMGFVSTVEDGYLLTGAQLCFLSGADAGAIFCAHASCERDLAAMVNAAETGPRGWERWGLGPLVTRCIEHHGLPRVLGQQLLDLNESRKTLYHFGHSDAEASLARATSALIETGGSEKLFEDFKKLNGREGCNKEVWRYAMDRVLEDKALAAIDATLRLRSWFAVKEFPGVDADRACGCSGQPE